MDWKTWKNEKTFSSQGKVRGFLTDWKSQGILPKMLENEEILASFYHNFFSDFLIEVYLLNRFLNLVSS